MKSTGLPIEDMIWYDRHMLDLLLTVADNFSGVHLSIIAKMAHLRTDGADRGSMNGIFGATARTTSKTSAAMVW